MLVGLSALEFQRADTTKPFWDALNLRRARARLLVVKKNATVLGKVRSRWSASEAAATLGMCLPSSSTMSQIRRQ